MTANELKNRFRLLSKRIIKLVDNLPNTIAGKAIGAQIIRSGTSPGTNYRAACRAKSDKDFINKLKIVEEELDETEYWLQVISDSELINPELLKEIIKETNELLAIITKSIITKKEKINHKSLNCKS